MSLDEIERATQDSIVARRNMMLGIWAGMRLGLRGDRLALYARDVMDADYREPGPYDVVSKIADDFDLHGVDLDATTIIGQMKQIERNLRSEMLVTD